MACGIKHVTVCLSFVVSYLIHIQAVSGEQNSTNTKQHFHPSLLGSNTVHTPPTRTQPLQYLQRQNSHTMEIKLVSIAAESREQNSTSTEVYINRHLVTSNDVPKHQPPESLQRQSPYIMKSKWVSIAGCGYWSFNKYDTLSSTEETFRQYFKGNFSREEDRFQCSLKCSSKLGIIYFVFHKTVCMCISNEHLLVERDNLSCLKMCKTTEHYCYSGDGLPVFVFKNPIKETQIPKKLMNYLHQRCLKGENGIYKSQEKRICLALLSKEDCSNLNVVFSHGVTSANLFVQWICERSNDTYTQYFRTIHKSTGYPSSTEQLFTTVSESFIDQGYSSNRSENSTVSANTSDADNPGIFIFNGVLLFVVVIILAAYGKLHVHSRIRNSSETKQLGTPNDQANARSSSHYDTIGIEVGSVERDCTVHISNQVYSVADDHSQ